MTRNSFYVDTCIYLNLWKLEIGINTNEPYWEYAQKFFEKYDSDDTIYYYSKLILREVEPKIPYSSFIKKMQMFKSTPTFKEVFVEKDDFSKAREIESILNYEISFFDILHMLLAIKTGSVLVTRDRKLLAAAKNYPVIAKRPEEL